VSDERPTASTKAPAADDDGLFHMHARCHLGARLAAWIDPHNQLTIACGECWHPLVRLVDHHGVFAGIRALGCEVDPRV
jgi:hypothetical protein